MEKPEINIEKIQKEKDEKIAIIAFYHFKNISNPDNIKPKIKALAKKRKILGTIIVAKEGFNGSISGLEEDLHLLLDELKELTKMEKNEKISKKTNYCEKQPFVRLKVKSKKEIVTLRNGEIDVENLKGKYIDSKNWSDFIKRDDVVLIDTRNDYEVEIGTFEGAIDPKTKCFAEFPKWTKDNMDMLKDKKVAMFCTGGIRCEKSTAFLKTMGVEEVFHLNGGILQYLKDTKNESGSWKGECFVFDGRGSVSADLGPKEIVYKERELKKKRIQKLQEINKQKIKERNIKRREKKEQERKEREFKENKTKETIDEKEIINEKLIK